MLTELSIGNFKSWKEIGEMKLAPITGLFGVNSSGKTSILQFLLMLKQTVESSDRAQALIFGNEKTPVNLGSFQEIIYSHDLNNSFTCRIKWRRAKNLKIKDPFDQKAIIFDSGDMWFETEVIQEKDRLKVKSLVYQLGSDRFKMERENGNGKYRLNYENAKNQQGFKFIRTQGRPWELPSPVKCYGFPDEVKAYFQNAGFMSDLQLAFEEMFSNVYYLGPLREYPKRQYSWSGSEPADMGQRGEHVVDALLAARINNTTISMGQRQKRRLLEEHVAWWLKELGLIHDFKVDTISSSSGLYKVTVRKTSQCPEALITDVGFGVSQILPVLVLCFYVPEGSTIILEQPEIHLHPSVQAGLADVFIDAVKRKNIQIIFESHSEHLLRRIQRRVAENKISNEKIALYFCEMAGSHSELSALDLEKSGNIINWPKDFFGDEFGELAATVKAGIERQKNEQIQ
ncbi:MAG: DUF3696 domain-containing protein [Planctomycetes bacterium]|nr:DUF3696 domain-containing protein [Planctomycetota bacterium]